jgi:cyclophilin family peptidyl-prolyl cis-trans isomerase
MSVLVETSLGEFVVDLYTDMCPIAAKNFLKLCKMKYYNNVLFFNVQQNFIIQSGDPTGEMLPRLLGAQLVQSWCYGRIRGFCIRPTGGTRLRIEESL